VVPERWLVLNGATHLWNAFMRAFERNNFVSAAVAFDSLLPALFVALGVPVPPLAPVPDPTAAGPGKGKAAAAAAAAASGNGVSDAAGGGSAAALASVLADEGGASFHHDGMGLLGAPSKPGGAAFGARESDILGRIGAAAIRGLLQAYVAARCGITLSAAVAPSELRRLCAIEPTRFEGPHDPQSPLLARVVQWSQAIVAACTPADGREACTLGVAARRYQGLPADRYDEPQLRVATLLEQADACPTTSPVRDVVT
jgi:hypothetical protein